MLVTIYPCTHLACLSPSSARDERDLPTAKSSEESCDPTHTLRSHLQQDLGQLSKDQENQLEARDGTCLANDPPSPLLFTLCPPFGPTGLVRDLHLSATSSESR
jgi:hypothetical protein